MSHGKTFTIFGEKQLGQLLRNKCNNIKTEIDNQPDNYILNVNETDFVSYVIDKYSIGNLEFQFDNPHISDYEKEIPVEELEPFERKFFGNGRKCKKAIVRYHIPFEGEDELLYYRPDHHVDWFPEVLMYKNCICFDLILRDNSRRMQEEFSSILRCLKQQSTYVTEQVDRYNNSLDNLAKNLFKERKEHLLKKNNLLASLGVPIIKRENVSQTFAIPTPQIRKKIHISRPVVTEKEYRPEPTLKDSDYQDILQYSAPK